MRASLQTLKDCRVLTVNRKDLHAVFFCERYDQMSGRHQGLLVGQSQGLAGLEHRRFKRQRHLHHGAAQIEGLHFRSGFLPVHPGQG